MCFAPEFDYPDGAYVELADGGAAIGHDVVLTAVLAVRTSGCQPIGSDGRT